MKRKPESTFSSKPAVKGGRTGIDPKIEAQIAENLKLAFTPEGDIPPLLQALMDRLKEQAESVPRQRACGMPG